MHGTVGLHRFLAQALFLVGLLLGQQDSATAAEVNLAWSPNIEGDLAGYGIYFRRDSAGPPFDLIGYIALEELPDLNTPTFTVSGLENGFDYYFVATAYDTAGNESAYSNTVCARVGERIELCSDAGGGSGGGGSGGSGGSGGGGSGGGGGGCFISTLSP